jgi:hypothetical protein
MLQDNVPPRFLATTPKKATPYFVNCFDSPSWEVSRHDNVYKHTSEHKLNLNLPSCPCHQLRLPAWQLISNAGDSDESL